MAIVPKFSEASVHKALAQKAKVIQIAIINRLKYMGERCLTECRTNKTYMDRTGNLTASMGYVIVANGRILESRGFTGTMGGQKGKSLADSIASRFKGGYALIVVAGMNYAAYVEAIGKNVLTSAEMLAEKELPVLVKALTRNINKM